MARSLMTGVSGLRAHQHQLDVVANNLANMNTIGFKAQTATFADTMYDTIRAGSEAAESFGGINLQQIGTGVGLAQVARRFQQGALQSTGELLDFAIQGDGFFMMQGSGDEVVFSRAGSFALDGEGNLVDPSTGYLIQRTGELGEGNTDNIGFQTPGDSRIQVPLGASIAGDQTNIVQFMGNLPSNSTPPVAEVLSSVEPFMTSTGIATSSTLFSDLSTNNTPYVPGDVIEFSGTSPDGSPYSGSIAADTGTLGDLVTALNGALSGATAELQTNGVLTITADDTGEAFTSLSISDAAGNVGDTNFSNNSMLVSTEGDAGDRFESSMEIFDKRGNNHRVRYSFEKVNTNGWELTAMLGDSSGELIDSQVLNLVFEEDGTFALAGSEGIGDSNIEINFDTIAENHVIDLDLSGLTHMATDFSITHVQDGAAPGSLVDIAVSFNGEITGQASNGKTIPIAQLAIARFANPRGLDGLGGNYFRETENSGAASIGSGLSGGRGQVVGNQLEASNVDIAHEFTQLIVAQRGFSANARTITVADEILEELTNIVR
ncbi:MAG: flagellar hook-basal body complex protein [Planctomycetota bacterium]